MNRATITERRAQLAAEQDRLELEYARAEEQINLFQRDLALRQRDLDVRSGAIRELDVLLALPNEATSERDAHTWQASENVRLANASIAEARDALAAVQSADDPHQHTRDIENSIRSAHEAAVIALAEVEAACDSPASPS